ncbi:MAG: thioredoxin [Actinobacteria bacterium]|nr:thioredoxin [Actinomycetota bacterium]MBV8394762.1 thioredoxin [Actinomycetota bacterium]MBV8599376.1 thioredoxin [Actinomycetota bacterium]
MNDHFGPPRFRSRTCSNVPSRSQSSRISSSSAFESGTAGRDRNTPSSLGGKIPRPSGVEPVSDERNRMALDVTEATFEQEVASSDKKVLVDFWAEWCGPCHAVAPVLDRIAEERDVKLVKVNVDVEQGLAQRYGVASIPTMILFENGEPQASAIGAMPKGALERALGLADEAAA